MPIRVGPGYVRIRSIILLMQSARVRKYSASEVFAVVHHAIQHLSAEGVFGPGFDAADQSAMITRLKIFPAFQKGFSLVLFFICYSRPNGPP